MRHILVIQFLIMLCSCESAPPNSQYTNMTFGKFVAFENDELLRNLPMAEDSGIVSCVYEPWIRGVEFPFNGGMVRLDNEWLLAFRENLSDKSHPYGFRTRIGILKLDDAFRPKSKPDFVEQPPDFPEDPRLITIQNALFVVANTPDSTNAKRRNMTLIALDKSQLGTGKLSPHFATTLSTGKNEKNWSPFIHDGQLNFSYLLTPSHEVLQLPDLKNSDSLFTLPRVQSQEVAWSYGAIRGGTPAVKIDNKRGYLGFFHSLYRAKSGQVVYFIGAYTFEANPPFQMTAMSRHPIVFRGLYSSVRSDVGGTDWFVAFPAGLEIINNSVFLSIGVNDSTLKIAELDLENLLASLRSLH